MRKLYLQRRKELSPGEIEAKTLAIARNFSALDFSAVRYLHLFYPIVAKSEFNSLVLADWIRAVHPEIKLVLSKSDLLANTLSHFIWNQKTKLAVNQWGITEPEAGVSVSPEQLDMVLIPLLAFDQKGNRVGYGKGFYDRFLSECRSGIQKVGVSFFPPVEEITDLNEFDIPVDICITPEKVWKLPG